MLYGADPAIRRRGQHRNPPAKFDPAPDTVTLLNKHLKNGDRHR